MINLIREDQPRLKIRGICPHKYVHHLHACRHPSRQMQATGLLYRFLLGSPSDTSVYLSTGADLPVPNFFSSFCLTFSNIVLATASDIEVDCIVRYFPKWRATWTRRLCKLYRVTRVAKSWTWSTSCGALGFSTSLDYLNWSFVGINPVAKAVCWKLLQRYHSPERKICAPALRQKSS